MPSDLAAKRILGTRIYAPSAGKSDGPPTDPEQIVKEAMEGGDRPGGVSVSCAGKAHVALTQAFRWKLWEAGLTLPGFVEIYFRPTSTLRPGTYEVVDGPRSPHVDFFREVRMGVEPLAFRNLCKGNDTAAGIELFGGAVSALAERFDLDRDLVDRVRTELREHELEFEVIMVAKPKGDGELRAILAFHANRKNELIVEHRTAARTWRTTLPWPHPDFVADDITLVKDVVHVKPAKRSMGPTVKIPLGD